MGQDEDSGTTWLDGLTIAAAVGLGALVYAAVNTLLANAPHLRALRGE